MVGDANDALPLAHLVLAHHQVGKANQLNGLELLVCADPLWVLIVLLGVVVGGISKVVVPIDLLVEIRSFLKTIIEATFEKVSSGGLQPEHMLEFLLDSHFVEVNRISRIK